MFINQPTPVLDRESSSPEASHLFLYDLVTPTTSRSKGPPASTSVARPTLKSMFISFKDSGNEMKLVDSNFYTSETISLLLGHEPVTENQRVVQLAINQCEGYMKELSLSPFQPVQLEQARLVDKNIFELADPVSSALEYTCHIIFLFSISHHLYQLACLLLFSLVTGISNPCPLASFL